jgi:hypothetical protein
MSYARFGCEDSDVYVYLDCNRYLCCCACALNETAPNALCPPSSRFLTTDALLAHLRDHAAAGHNVPTSTVADLERDRDENDAWILAGAPGGETP